MIISVIVCYCNQCVLLHVPNAIIHELTAPGYVYVLPVDYYEGSHCSLQETWTIEVLLNVSFSIMRCHWIRCQHALMMLSFRQLQGYGCGPAAPIILAYPTLFSLNYSLSQ